MEATGAEKDTLAGTTLTIIGLHATDIVQQPATDINGLIAPIITGALAIEISAQLKAYGKM